VDAPVKDAEFEILDKRGAPRQRPLMSYTIDATSCSTPPDRTPPFHRAAGEFLRGRPADRDILCLTWPVIMAYVRPATHPRIFDARMTPRAALDNVAGLMRMSRCRGVTEPDGLLDTCRDVALEVAARGNLAPDAHLAAFLRSHGVRTIYTHDRDLRKFPFLTVVDPLY
jgi:toxin-antitoxin system PIN domain toxin